MNCEQANQIEINGFLSQLNIYPSFVRNHKWWYLSPLRSESTPSFKVDAHLNLWYDFGIGKGGNLIDLGCLLFNTDVSGLLNKLAHGNFSYHKPEPIVEDPILKIKEIKKLTNVSLIIYLLKRGIRLVNAFKYCHEIHFELNSKLYYDIGFENDLHGFELRNKYFKFSSSPKTVTWIKNNSNTLCVFEGFMDFLSWFEIKLFQRSHADFLILNSVAFVEKCKEIMVNYQKVELYLDNDHAGEKATEELVKLGHKHCTDRSDEFGNSKDLNDYLMAVKFKKSIEQSKADQLVK